MKIKLFVAREIEYFELGIFSFNSYVYNLTRSFIALTRAFNLLIRAFNLVTRAYSFLNHKFELITRRFKLVTRRLELVTRKLELVFYFSTLSVLSTHQFILLYFFKEIVSCFMYIFKSKLLTYIF